MGSNLFNGMCKSSAVTVKANEMKTNQSLFNSKAFRDYIIQLAREHIKIRQGQLDKDAEEKLSLGSRPGSSI